MKKDVVIYNNYLNNLALSGFTADELDLLMAICSRMKNQNLNEITFDFVELKELANSKKNRIDDFIKTLKGTYVKLSRITCRIESKDEEVFFVLFPTFIHDKSRQTLTVKVNPDFRFVLNDLTANFTRFELEEFVHLSGRYPKQLYRLLKQFRTTGLFKISIEDFRKKMDIPDSYKARDILEKVIKPTIFELEKCFPGLSVTVEKARRRGAPVIGYIFTFQQEKVPKNQGKKVEKKKSGKAQTPKGSFYNFEQRNYENDEAVKQLALGISKNRENNQ